MDDERLKELRQQAKVVAQRVSAARCADEVVDFFTNVRGQFEREGHILQVSQAGVAVFPYARTAGATEISPGYKSDWELNLWRACLKEMHEQVRAVISQLLDTYLLMAEAHRDAMLCGVCGEDYQPTIEGRELRGVHLREKGATDGDSEVSE